MDRKNLLTDPEPSFLPEEPEMLVLEKITQGVVLEKLAQQFPSSSLVWAQLSQQAFQNNEIVQSYAYARVAYHRGLDALRRVGWKGHGLVPFSHKPNQGFLLALYFLARAARQIGEISEAVRLDKFLEDSDPQAYKAIADKTEI